MAMTKKQLEKEFAGRHFTEMQKIEALERRVTELETTLSAVTAALQEVRDLDLHDFSRYTTRYVVPAPTTPTMSAGEVTFGQLARLVIDGERILGERTTREYVGINPAALVNPDGTPE